MSIRLLITGASLIAAGVYIGVRLAQQRTSLPSISPVQREDPAPAVESEMQSDPSPEQAPPLYGRVANSTSRMLAEKIRAGELVDRNGRTLRYTASTGWLLTCIINNITRATNSLEATVDQMVEFSGLSRQAVLDHTHLLEAAAVLSVIRSSLTPSRNAINIYRLAGETASVATFDSSQQNRLSKGKSSVQSADGLLKDSKSVGLVDDIQQPIQTKIVCGQFTRQPAEVDMDSEPVEVPYWAKVIGMDFDVARAFVRQHGQEYVSEMCRHAEKASWAHNRAGLAISWMQSGKPVPEEYDPDQDYGRRYTSGKYGQYIKT